uniref:Uncharacterized protein n=1 Tax=Micrurus lemniscatus lemniscatus TaxID=129467 RepID=A0A2D4IQF2_MICLE
MPPKSFLHLKWALPTTEKCFEHKLFFFNSYFDHGRFPKGFEFKTFHKSLICILSYQINYIKEKEWFLEDLEKQQTLQALKYYPMCKMLDFNRDMHIDICICSPSI